MTEATTAAFEAEHVHAVYDEIAADFSRTRHSPWPFVRHFLASLPSASLVLDAGTGNGKYLGTRSVLDYAGKHDPPPTRRRRAQEETPSTKSDMLTIGFDMSNGLLSIASERGHEVVRGDCVDLSCWRRGAFDHAISIATIHHFATPERRIESIKQMILAVLPPTPPPSSSSNADASRPRSRILIVVWSLEQDPALVDDDRSARRTRGGKQGAVPAPLASGSAPSDGDDEARKTLEEEEEGGGAKEVQDVFVPWARQNQIPRQQKATPTGRVSSNGAGSPSSSSNAKKQPASVPKRTERGQSPSSKGGAPQKVLPSSATGAATEPSQQPENTTEAEAATAPSPSPAPTPTPTPAPAPAPAKGEPGTSSEAATTTETDKTETKTAPTFNRYYHLFRHYELSSLVQSAASQLGLAFSHPEGYPLPPSSNPSNPSNPSAFEEAKYTKEGEGRWEARVRLCEERWERENWVVEVEVGWSPESGGQGHGHGHGHAGAAAPPPEVASTSAE